MDLLFNGSLCGWQGPIQNFPDKDFKLWRDLRFPQPDPAFPIHPAHRFPPPTPSPVKLNCQMVSRLNRKHPISSVMPDKFIIHIPPRKWDSLNGPTDRRVRPLTKLILIPTPFPLTNNLRHHGITPIWQDAGIIARGIQLKTRNPFRMNKGGREAIAYLPS
ncbi:unnamed protein product [Linum trigynum]|uniref:Uncharacterized protein n=1 Tax=Linum trigynum TaxID=586398 RepID=A0AAV2CQG5_9ROSI